MIPVGCLLLIFVVGALGGVGISLLNDLSATHGIGVAILCGIGLMILGALTLESKHDDPPR